MALQLAIFDFNRTLFETESRAFYDGALELLKELRSRDVKLALWTRDERGQTELQQREGIAELFDYMHVSPVKDADSLRGIAEHLSVPLKHVVVVTDPVRVDLAAANEAGVTVLSIRQGKFAIDIPYAPEETPTIEVSDIAGVRDVLMELLDGPASDK